MPFKHGGSCLNTLFSGWVNAFFAALPLSTVAFFRSGQKSVRTTLERNTLCKSAKASISILSNPETNATIQKTFVPFFSSKKKSKIGIPSKNGLKKVSK
jgi:hypothetical protein